MEESPGLKYQAQLLMSMIDYAVSQLGNLAELTIKLKDLGATHFKQYQVKPEHFKVHTRMETNFKLAWFTLGTIRLQV